MDATLLAALQARNPLVFIAARITVGASTVRLLNGSGTVSFNPGGGSETFTGRDATFGTLKLNEGLSDGTGTEAVSLSLSLLPPDLTAAETLVAPTRFRDPVKVWLGAINRSTGASIGSPELLFAGQLNQATFIRRKNGMEVAQLYMGGNEALVRQNEGKRLNHAWMTRKSGSDAKGLIFVSNVERPIYFMRDDPRPAAILPGSKAHPGVGSAMGQGIFVYSGGFQ